MTIQFPTIDLTFEGVTLISAFLVLLAGLVFKGWKQIASIISIVLLMAAFGFFLKNFGLYADKLNHLSSSYSNHTVAVAPAPYIEEGEGFEVASSEDSEKSDEEISNNTAETVQESTVQDEELSPAGRTDGWRVAPWER
jgi:hypothetical protein